ncbi:hypothetical protein Cgig2_006947 [Carnegiea gigantea]|uniref:Coatomer beta subunit C-terminal domain-containing protein n=1 Tax=Carnegiea gigantea TaxID=171969 RepID=A0A9Q1QG26_9CARY|nr:hypothetical protein Cgig2_006947 [Carnegiea gigantea]
MLVRAIHTCSMKFAEVASLVIYVLMDFLSDANVASAMDVVVFVHVLLKSSVLWIIREYCFSLSKVESGIATIKQCLGDLPFYSTTSTVTVSLPVVLAVGIYATQRATLETVMSPPTFFQGSLTSQGNRRSLVLSGDFFPWAVITCTLVKLGLKRFSHSGLKRTKQPPRPYYISGICDSTGAITSLDFYAILVITVDRCAFTFAEEALLRCLQQPCETKERNTKAQVSHAHVDDLFDFHHLRSRKKTSIIVMFDGGLLTGEVYWDKKIEGIEEGCSCAIRNVYKFPGNEPVGIGSMLLENSLKSDGANKLNCNLQLTEFNNPVYAKVYVTFHRYDIILVLLLSTERNLQNLWLGLATMGDLKLAEHP